MTAAINFLLDLFLIVGLISAIAVVVALAASFIVYIVSQLRYL